MCTSIFVLAIWDQIFHVFSEKRNYHISMVSTQWISLSMQHSNSYFLSMQEEWPEGYKLAMQMNFNFPDCSGTPLKELIPLASNDGINVIGSLIHWCPNKRPKADQVKWLLFDDRHRLMHYIAFSLCVSACLSCPPLPFPLPKGGGYHRKASVCLQCLSHPYFRTGQSLQRPTQERQALRTQNHLPRYDFSAKPSPGPAPVPAPAEDYKSSKPKNVSATSRHCRRAEHLLAFNLPCCRYLALFKRHVTVVL